MDMLEMARLPDSTDLLGTYEVDLDETGNVVKFEKTRTHLRGTPFEVERE